MQPMPAQLELFSGFSVPEIVGDDDSITNHTRDPTGDIPENRRLSLNKSQENLACSLREKSRELVKKSIKKHQPQE